jgi:LPXTG-motif cell wall-anchored protein
LTVTPILDRVGVTAIQGRITMKRITLILSTMLVAFLMGGSWAWAGETPSSDDDCTTETTGWVLESPGQDWTQVDQRTVVDEEAWDETVVDVEAQHYSLKGNSGIGKDEIPVFPADYWQANAPLEPHYQGHGLPASNVDGSDYIEGQSGLHYTSQGSEGLRDWFYFQAEESHVVHHDAVTHEEFVFSKTTCDNPHPQTIALRAHKSTCEGNFMATITITTLDGKVISKERSKWVKVSNLTHAQKVQLECLTPIKPEPTPDKPEGAVPVAEELPHTGGNLALAGIAGALLAAGSGLVWFSRRRLTDV